jgi:hypothetical protein
VTHYFCGPLRVSVDAQTHALHEKVAETLRLYDRRWPAPDQAVALTVVEANGPAPAMGRGTFLRCARMVVDAAGDGLHATTTSGSQARSRTNAGAEHWSIEVPNDAVGTTAFNDVEDLVILALTSGWRKAGWVPIHGAAIAKDGVCAILCAASGVGKSTLTAAFIRRGWHAVGDDKLLLRMTSDGPELAALQGTFNLHPQTRAWFPEVGELEKLPIYSTWTEKRKVRVETIWADAVVATATPTHVIRVRRDPSSSALRVRELPSEDLFPTLIRQIAVPTEREAASLILRTVAPTLRRVRGLDLAVGNDAYRHADALDALEAALR